jgi:hypothetical protein
VIVPDTELPLSEPGFVAAVREYMKRSRLSVHLIGAHYGIVPEGEMERSIVRLQYDLAVERASDPEFWQIIWLPPDLAPQDERQWKFIHDLQNLSSHSGSELIQTRLEDLKTIIQDRLTPRPKSARAMNHADGPARIYLICDQQDVEAVEPLQDFLFEQGYEVVLPLPGGSGAEVLQDHKDSLLLCGAVLIYQGRAGEAWLRMKLRELLKLPGYGRTSSLLAKAVYIGPPKSPQKDRFRTNEALLIKNYGDFNPASLTPLVAELNQAKGTLRR